MNGSKDEPDLAELLKGIYVVLLQIKDYQYTILQALDEQKLMSPRTMGEAVSDVHEDGQLVLELPFLDLQPEEDES